jgi:hypothetical protein
VLFEITCSSLDAAVETLSDPVGPGYKTLNLSVFKREDKGLRSIERPSRLPNVRHAPRMSEPLVFRSVYFLRTLGEGLAKRVKQNKMALENAPSMEHHGETLSIRPVSI